MTLHFPLAVVSFLVKLSGSIKKGSNVQITVENCQYCDHLTTSTEEASLVEIKTAASSKRKIAMNRSQRVESVILRRQPPPSSLFGRKTTLKSPRGRLQQDLQANPARVGLSKLFLRRK